MAGQMRMGKAMTLPERLVRRTTPLAKFLMNDNHI